jgi:hypothetical protein
MNINSEFNKDSSSPFNAVEAMDSCMSVISDILIQPAMDREELDLEQSKMLSTVAEALQTIAKKAYAFEKMADLKQNNFGRN